MISTELATKEVTEPRSRVSRERGQVARLRAGSKSKATLGSDLKSGRVKARMLLYDGFRDGECLRHLVTFSRFFMALTPAATSSLQFSGK